MYVLLAAAAVLLVAAMVFYRITLRRHVAALFRSTVRNLVARGIETESALRQGLQRFTRRPPFNRIQPDELSYFVHTLQDLASPIEVGAELLQQCEDKRSSSEIRDGGRMTRLAYSIDLKLSLKEMIRDASLLHAKLNQRYPNLTVALLASLSAREGWTFVEEQDDALIYDYRHDRVRIPKRGSGKDAARLVLFEEMARRPMLNRAETGVEARKSARQSLIDDFDSIFDEAFQQVAETR